MIDSDGWRLVGDLRLPASDRASPAVLLLNEGAGDRRAYTELASRSTRRGIAALRFDLRGHGESRRTAEILFVPGAEHATRILDAQADPAERIATWFARTLSAARQMH